MIAVFRRYYLLYGCLLCSILLRGECATRTGKVIHDALSDATAKDATDIAANATTAVEFKSTSRSLKKVEIPREQDGYEFASLYPTSHSNDHSYERYSSSEGDDNVDSIHNFNVNGPKQKVSNVVRRPQGFISNWSPTTTTTTTTTASVAGVSAFSAKEIGPLRASLPFVHSSVRHSDNNDSTSSAANPTRVKIVNSSTVGYNAGSISKNEIQRKPSFKPIPASTAAVLPPFGSRRKIADNSLPTTSTAWALAAMRPTNASRIKLPQPPNNTAPPSTKKDAAGGSSTLPTIWEKNSASNGLSSGGSGGANVNPSIKPFVSWSTRLQRPTTEQAKELTTITEPSYKVDDTTPSTTYVKPKITKSSTTSSIISIQHDILDQSREQNATSTTSHIQFMIPNRDSHMPNDVIQNDVEVTFSNKDDDSRNKDDKPTLLTSSTMNYSAMESQTTTWDLADFVTTILPISTMNNTPTHEITPVSVNGAEHTNLLATNFSEVSSANAAERGESISKADDNFGKPTVAMNSSSWAELMSPPMTNIRTLQKNLTFSSFPASTDSSGASNVSHDSELVTSFTKTEDESAARLPFANITTISSQNLSSYKTMTPSFDDVPASSDRATTLSEPTTTSPTTSSVRFSFSTVPSVSMLNAVRTTATSQQNVSHPATMTSNIVQSSTSIANVSTTAKSYGYATVLPTQFTTIAANSTVNRAIVPSSFADISSISSISSNISSSSSNNPIPSTITTTPATTTTTTTTSTTTATSTTTMTSTTTAASTTTSTTIPTTTVTITVSTGETNTVTAVTSTAKSSFNPTSFTASITPITSISTTTTAHTTSTPITTSYAPKISTTTPISNTFTTISIKNSAASSTHRTPNATTSSEDTQSTFKQKIGASNVPGYLKLVLKTTVADVCKTSTLQENLFQFITQRSLRVQSKDQVVMMIDPQECKEPSHSTKSIPVALYIVDETGSYDKSLIDEMKTLLEEDSVGNYTLPIHEIVFRENVPNTSRVIAAMIITSIAAVCFVLLVFLMCAIRNRQKQNFRQRCTPVSPDDYNLDNISEYNSIRRCRTSRMSKRSYGNPTFDDPTSPSRVLTFNGLMKAIENRSALDTEFSQIPTITVKAEELPPGAETRNRYANVIPLPETRVSLDATNKFSNSEDDYINANYVKGFEGVDKFYIACQAPLSNTIQDFWKMVWKDQTKIIIMLTSLTENGVEKCADYLPPSEVLDCHRLFGDYQITLLKREVKEKYIISSLQLKNMENNLWREVTHLWYTSWPAKGVPNEQSSIIAFLIEARAYMRNSGGPHVVHCSPGTGRTGTVIAIDICIRDYESTRTVNVPATVSMLRRCRAGAVQTKEQYAFIYKVLALYAKKLNGGTSLDSM